MGKHIVLYYVLIITYQSISKDVLHIKKEPKQHILNKMTYYNLYIHCTNIKVKDPTINMTTVKPFYLLSKNKTPFMLKEMILHVYLYHIKSFN